MEHGANCSGKKDAMGMKLMKNGWLRVWRAVSCDRTLATKTYTSRGWGTGGRGTGMIRGVAECLLALTLAAMAMAQAVSTTTVQGTVYLANGQPGAGTLVISWPAFTTAAGQAVAADSTTLAIGPDGFVSVNLAANVGATPAGEYYTAVYYMSDGTTSTQYWVVPAAAQASLAQVQAQVMPAAQAVQAVSKAYVDQAIAELTESLLTAIGRDADRAAVFERRSDAAVAGGGQTLCGHAGGDGGAAGGREHDGRADHAGGEWGAGAGGGERADDAAGGDECGGNERGDGDSADVCGDGYVYESERRAGDGSADDGRAADGAQREGVWRGVRRRDGRYECAAGGAELCQGAWSGADDSAGNMQDADAELAWRVDWRTGQAGFGADGISGTGCAGDGRGQRRTC